MINVLYIPLAVFVYIFIGTLFNKVLHELLGEPDSEVAACIVSYAWPISAPVVIVIFGAGFVVGVCETIISFITRGRL
jgi:hypothetical protein